MKYKQVDTDYTELPEVRHIAAMRGVLNGKHKDPQFAGWPAGKGRQR